MTSPTVAAERAYLATARADLARMREHTLALDARGGDAGDPVVIDWRAQVSTAFYRATRTEPMDVVLRRRFGFERGQITAYEDEHLLDRDETDARSQILTREIERPRVGPMRDIVATIQPEQDVIVRADVAETVCVQGAPGTGKTAVGLHRAAYLLYTFGDRLRRGGVLVIGPNSAFLSYISAVLPALGEVDVRQVTLDELVAARVAVRGEDTAPVATLKGDARMARVLENAVYAGLVAPTEALVVPIGSRRWRVGTPELSDVVAQLRGRDVRYGAARAMLSQRLAHAVLTKMEAAGESPDDRTQDAVARSVPVRRMVASLWPAAGLVDREPSLGKPSAHVEVLRRGYRVPANVIDFASRLLPHIAPGVAPAESVRENVGVLELLPATDLTRAVDEAVTRVLGLPGSVGVIVADDDVVRLGRSLAVEHALLGRDPDGPRVTLVPATLAKGLEFDHVVVVEPAAIVAAEPSVWQGLRRLYVVLTRAVSGLSVVHARPLPAELGA